MPLEILVQKELLILEFEFNGNHMQYLIHARRAGYSCEFTLKILKLYKLHHSM
jgi:hypothetical protein